jgi:hypothetical protein
MKKLLPFLFVLALMPAYSQELGDSASIWTVETTDGNEFTGTIIFEDSTGIILKTSIYGELHIETRHIKKLEMIPPDRLVDGEYWFGNPHATRYFFGPNVYGLKKGEGYYQNTWIFLNQLNYGINDYLSLGGGIMPLFLIAGSPTPVWLTPKLSVPIVQDKFNLGAGMLFIHVLGDGSSFGIAYGASTFGNKESNLTLGAGWGFSGYESNWDWSDRITLMLSGMTRVGKKTYLLTENYYMSLGSGDSFGIIMLGGRSVQKRLAVDYGLVLPLGTDMGEFIAIPWLSITLPFGNFEAK